MDSMELHRALRAHCQKEKADCTKCCLRLFCYTPPCEMTDGWRMLFRLPPVSIATRKVKLIYAIAVTVGRCRAHVNWT